MTELGITQEYLLLAVNDRGRFSPLNPQQPICFVAAALGELTEAGCIAFTGEKVGLSGPLPEELRCLKPLYDFIDRPRPVSLSMVLRDFAPDGPKLAELAEAVGESLEALRLAAPQRALAGRVFYLPAAGEAARRLERLLFRLCGEAGPAPKEAALAVLLLFYVSARYKHLSSMVTGSLDKDNGFLRFVVNDFASAYKKYGLEVNTPALVQNAVSVKLSGLLLIERFLNNAVSLFVTLGLFGTFLGLSLSVSSLTELIGYSNTDQWLSVLDSVGEGLMSALSGMGVAFYTSLVGVACSILLTLLRSVFSPQAQREKLETQVELWLDHSVAPTLPTEKAKDNADLIRQMIHALDAAAESMDKTLKRSTDELKLTLAASQKPLEDFNRTVDSFNEGVRDFSEFNYNLRGTVERMDVCIRDLVSVLRSSARGLERSERQ